MAVASIDVITSRLLQEERISSTQRIEEGSISSSLGGLMSQDFHEVVG